MKPGEILGIFGQMGSGKTAFAIALSRYFQTHHPGTTVYTNIPKVPGFIYIERISEIPINQEPKILLIDEIMFSFDSRMFSSTNNKMLSRFLAYLRKIETSLYYATHDPGMVDVRLRQHTTYACFFKDEKTHFSGLMIDCMSEEKNMFHIVRCSAYFAYCNYNTRAFPAELECDVDLKESYTFD